MLYYYFVAMLLSYIMKSCNKYTSMGWTLAIAFISPNIGALNWAVSECAVMSQSEDPDIRLPDLYITKSFVGFINSTFYKTNLSLSVSLLPKSWAVIGACASEGCVNETNFVIVLYQGSSSNSGRPIAFKGCKQYIKRIKYYV